MITFQDFLSAYDHPGTIILLEGKRKVLPGDEPFLMALGEKLCREMKFARFRSGNAPGSDELFAQGISKSEPARMEVILPYSGHRNKSNQGYATHALDEINLASEPEVTYQTKINKRNSKFIDDFVGGESNRITIKAAYLLRDTVKVTGTNSGIPKATFAIFYDDLENPWQGGTGHTMMVCKNTGVPFINQTVWKSWV